MIYSKNRWTYALWVFNVYDMEFDNIENKHHVYRDKDCIKKFCELSREHAMKVINFQKKKMIP